MYVNEYSTFSPPSAERYRLQTLLDVEYYSVQIIKFLFPFKVKIDPISLDIVKTKIFGRYWNCSSVVAKKKKKKKKKRGKEKKRILAECF